MGLKGRKYILNISKNMLPENNFYVASSQPDQGSTMSNSSAWGVVNNLLIVRSETVASCTASNPDGVVWVVDIVESRCSSDEYHDYQSSTEKILFKAAANF